MSGGGQNTSGYSSNSSLDQIVGAGIKGSMDGPRGVSPMEDYPYGLPDEEEEAAGDEVATAAENVKPTIVLMGLKRSFLAHNITY